MRLNGAGTAEFPRRVMMTADTVGGVWPYALELAAGLARRGVLSLIAAMGDAPTPAQRRDAARIAGVQLVHRPFRLEWMPDGAGDLAPAGAWLMDLAGRFRPDIVQINGYAAATSPWRCPVVVVCHSCVRSWWRAVRGCEAPPEWRAYGRRVAQGLAAADAVIAPTAAFLADMRALYGPLPPAAVIHNSRSAGVFRPAAVKEPVIVTAGRLWDQAKNVALVETVAPRLPWPVAMAGDGGGRQGAANVHALGVLDQAALAGWLGRAAIFTLPARYEPFGLAVLEAALRECALVLGDIATLRELWRDAALFVDPDDPAGLEAALRRLIDDPGLRRALAAAARERAGTFSPESMTERYLAAYRGARAHAAHRKRADESRIGAARKNERTGRAPAWGKERGAAP